MPQLRWLDLGYTAVSDTGLARLRGLQGLRTLDLAGTNVSDAGMKHLGSLGGLVELNLRATRVTDAGLAYLRGLKLDSLDLSETKITNAGIENLSRLETLEETESLPNEGHGRRTWAPQMLGGPSQPGPFRHQCHGRRTKGPGVLAESSVPGTCQLQADRRRDGRACRSDATRSVGYRIHRRRRRRTRAPHMLDEATDPGTQQLAYYACRTNQAATEHSGSIQVMIARGDWAAGPPCAASCLSRGGCGVGRRRTAGSWRPPLPSWGPRYWPEPSPWPCVRPTLSASSVAAWRTSNRAGMIWQSTA